ncbi:MAG: hypothetical protein MUF81_19475 [Verrucomicrobia bacterium]|nr:hypothetical protein [Verrucomicrobiota bacterium]
MPNKAAGYFFAVFLGACGVGLIVAADTIAPVPDLILQTVRGGLVALGGVFIYWGFAYARFARREFDRFMAAFQLEQDYPGQPWKWRPEWDGRAIPSLNRAESRFRVKFTIGANIFLWAFGWGLWRSHPDPVLPLTLFAAFFPLLGLGLAWHAAYHVIRGWKFGDARFLPSTVPGAIGGYLRGTILVPARVDLQDDALITLQCIHRVSERLAGDRQHVIREKIQWERSKRLNREEWNTAAGRTEIRVEFAIDPDCPPTEVTDDFERLFWKLAVKARTRGVDFAAEFEVPVFRTES